MENVKISYLKDEQGSIISPVVSIKSVFDEDNQPLVIDSGLPIGSGMDYFGTTAPVNYMFADGSAISRTEYSELFSIIGTTYGSGDGSTTFNLPDKRTRVSVMKNASGTFATLGQTGGAETHTLTVAQMPSHTHTQNSHNHTQNPHLHGVTASGSWNSGATGRLKYEESNSTHWMSSCMSSATATNNATTATNQNTGGGQAHNNLQPYLVCNYIIKVKNSKISALSLVLSDLEGEY